MLLHSGARTIRKLGSQCNYKVLESLPQSGTGITKWFSTSL